MNQNSGDVELEFLVDEHPSRPYGHPGPPPSPETISIALDVMHHIGGEEPKAPDWSKLDRVPILDGYDIAMEDRARTKQAVALLETLQWFVAGFRTHFFEASDQYAIKSLHTLITQAYLSGRYIGQRDSAFDMRVQESVEDRRLRGWAKGTRTQKAKSDKVREAALAFIREHPNATQSSCVRHVAHTLNRDDSNVRRVVKEFFEWRDLAGGAREKRPRRDIQEG